MVNALVLASFLHLGKNDALRQWVIRRVRKPVMETTIALLRRGS
ncbi:hypothetical protein QWZ13_13745 [Reinekea marina]|nr:hypothetical protein [Reinekea marina]MDN3649978.1 hypothetical protein [Reinekea marina]